MVKALGFFALQVLVFFVTLITVGYFTGEPVRPAGNIAIAAAYGSLFVLPVILSILTKSYSSLLILTLVLGAYIDARVLDNSTAHYVIVYLCIGGTAFFLEKYFMGWLSIMTGGWGLYLFVKAGVNIAAGTHTADMLIWNLLFSSILILPFCKMLMDYEPRPKAQTGFTDYEEKKAA